MGLTHFEIKRLASAARAGNGFAEVLTIGRQTLYLHPRDVKDLEAEFGLRLPGEMTEWGAYAEPLLVELLGARSIEVMDASDYEEATVVHDLNLPVPRDLHERFDAVVDGGSIEHVFDVPEALANLMRMVRVGGSLFLSNPANNLCGHGFYQFSPELAFSSLRPERGFDETRVSLVEARFPSIELTRGRRVLEVTDPAEARQRVIRMSPRPAMLFVESRKVKHLEEPLLPAPQQSDYVAAWSTLDRSTKPPGLAVRAFYRLVEILPRPLGNLMLGSSEAMRASRFNGSHYRRS